MARSVKASFVLNTTYGVAQSAVAFLVPFLLVPFMIARMGQRDYGLWVMLQVFGILGYLAFAEAGYQESLLRRLAKLRSEGATEEFRRLFVSGLMLFGCIGAACCAGVLVFDAVALLRVFDAIPAVRAGQMQWAVAVVGLSLLFQFPAMALKSFYSAVQDFKRLRLWESLELIVFAAAVFVLLWFRTSILLVAVTQTAVQLLLFVVFLLAPLAAHRPLYSLNLARARFGAIRGISSMSGYLMLHRLPGYVLGRTPLIVIGILLTPVYATYYDVLRKVPRAMKQLEGMLTSAVLPLAISLETLEQQARMKWLMLRGTRYSFAALTPAVAFILVFAEEFLRLWIPADNYAHLANLLRAWVVYQYALVLIVFGSSMYTRKEHIRRLLPYSLSGAVLFIVVLVALTPAWRLWALIAALALSGGIALISNMAIIRSMHTFTAREFFAHVLRVPVLIGGAVCAAVMTALKLWAAPPNLVVLLAYLAGAYVFYAVVMVTLGLEDYERRDWAAAMQRLRGRGQRP